MSGQNPSLALQTHRLPNLGYYVEDVSPALVLSHYHTTYIPFNISKFEYTISKLFTNLLIITPIAQQANNTLILNQLSDLSKSLNDTHETFEKLKFHQKEANRKKRGLIDGLGSVIKFITGNLDNKDLETISHNLQIIKHNEINTMHKLNEFSSFAGNIMDQFDKNIRAINQNSKDIQKQITKLHDNIYLITSMQHQFTQITKLNLLLEKLLRIISFANVQTLDLEILNLSEIKQLWNFLILHYPHNTLWNLNHLSELTLICKTGFLLLNEMAILVIKIPIFEQFECNLKQIYPIPTNESNILINPSKYYCNDTWYSNCKEVNSKWICSELAPSTCRLKIDCPYAKITNNYIVHTKTYKNNLLYCSKNEETLYENCLEFRIEKLKGCFLIQSKCDVIINKSKYSLSINNITFDTTETVEIQQTNLSLKLKLEHLDNPSKLHESLLDPISFQDVTIPQRHYVIHIVISIIFVLILVFVLYCYKKKSKLIPVKLLEKLINEDIDNTKGGGVMSPELSNHNKNPNDD